MINIFEYIYKFILHYINIILSEYIFHIYYKHFQLTFIKGALTTTQIESLYSNPSQCLP